MKYQNLMASVAGAITLICTSQGFAYEIETHSQLSQQAAAQSVRMAETLTNFGLTDASTLTMITPDGSPTSKPILEWIKEGAKREDDTSTEVFARYKNHFYDPTTGQGFGGILWRDSGIVSGMPAPDWAIDMVEADGQLYSFKQARTYFYDGLIKSTQAERESKLATMFRTLGDVVHIVQDMAQPQHTRNDGHGFPKSYYEVYTDDNRTNLLKALPAITTPSFSNARDFFVNSSYTGLSQYSNSNFVTAGTNFKMYQGKPVEIYIKRLVTAQHKLTAGGAS